MDGETHQELEGGCDEQNGDPLGVPSFFSGPEKMEMDGDANSAIMKQMTSDMQQCRAVSPGWRAGAPRGGGGEPPHGGKSNFFLVFLIPF